ncbi:MAG: hypothetical protein QM733_04050 [Ilumatobacteraceae bacterium]
MNGGETVTARAIVVQIRPGAPARGDAGEAPLATYLLALTVMLDDEPPFRCRVSATLPAAHQWHVCVGTHVPVTVTPGHDVVVDTAAIRRLFDLSERT